MARRVARNKNEKNTTEDPHGAARFLAASSGALETGHCAGFLGDRNIAAPKARKIEETLTVDIFRMIPHRRPFVLDIRTVTYYQVLRRASPFSRFARVPRRSSRRITRILNAQHFSTVFRWLQSPFSSRAEILPEHPSPAANSLFATAAWPRDHLSVIFISGERSAGKTRGRYVRVGQTQKRGGTDASKREDDTEGTRKIEHLVVCGSLSVPLSREPFPGSFPRRCSHPSSTSRGPRRCGTDARKCFSPIMKILRV